MGLCECVREDDLFTENDYVCISKDYDYACIHLK